MVPPNLVTFPVIIQHPEVGVYYTATQWALTFPNLRRHRCFQLPPASFLVLRSFHV